MDGTFRIDGQERTKLCGPLRPKFRLSDFDQMNASVVVRAVTHTGKEINAELRNSTLLKPNELVQVLADSGVEVCVGRDIGKHIAQYINMAMSKAQPARTRVRQQGWLQLPGGGKAYVLGNKCFVQNDPGKSSQVPIHTPYVSMTVGTVDQWNALLRPIGNCEVPVVTMCAAFSSALLEPLGQAPFIITLTGASSTGKTSTLRMCAALVGSPDDHATLNGTTIGIEAYALEHRDCPTVLDEIGQATPEMLSKLTYNFTNGQSRLRATSTGDKAASAAPRSVVFCAGELSVAEKLADGGKQMMLGQIARSINLSVDSVKGIWNNLPDGLDGKSVADSLRAGLHETYGVAWAPYIEHICQIEGGISKSFAKSRASIRKGILGELEFDEADAVANRVLDIFVMMYWAGQRARGAGVIPWTPKQLQVAHKKCFAIWYGAYKSSKPANDQDILSQIRLFFQSNREGKFIPFARYGEAGRSLAGYEHVLRGTTEKCFLVLPAYFEKRVFSEECG
jgi:uncharacterized protein (DUF927 family)